MEEVDEWPQCGHVFWRPRLCQVDQETYARKMSFLTEKKKQEEEARIQQRQTVRRKNSQCHPVYSSSSYGIGLFHYSSHGENASSPRLFAGGCHYESNLLGADCIHSKAR